MITYLNCWKIVFTSPYGLGPQVAFLKQEAVYKDFINDKKETYNKWTYARRLSGKIFTKKYLQIKLPAAVFVNGLVNAGKICFHRHCFAKALSPRRSRLQESSLHLINS